MFGNLDGGRKRLPRCQVVKSGGNMASSLSIASVGCADPVPTLVHQDISFSSLNSPNLFVSRSNMPEPKSGMEAHYYSNQQTNLWNELVQTVSISKQLSAAYISSVKDKKSDSKELLKAFKKSNQKIHVTLETFLNSFIPQEYSDDRNKSSDFETHHNPTQVSSGIPRSGSQEQLSDTKIQLLSKTEFPSQSRNLNRSPSNSHIPTQSRNVYWPSSNSPNQTQYGVRNKSRSKSQDRHELDTKSVYSSATRHRPRSRNSNRSPSIDRTQTHYRRRNRSRSRSYDKRHNSRSKYSPTNRRWSKSEIRKKSQSRSPDLKNNVTEDQSLAKQNKRRRLRALKNARLNSQIREKYDGHNYQNPSTKWKKYKHKQLTEPTSSSDSSQPEEGPPIPVVNSDTTTVPPTQAACQVPSPYYSHNVTPMYYAQPTQMPRLMPYYMPPRPRLPYVPTYPRMIYRPHW